MFRRTGPNVLLALATTLAIVVGSVAISGCGGDKEEEETSGGTEEVLGPKWFDEATTDVGLNFVHEVGPLGSYYFPQIVPPGAAFLDYDLDGDLDIYLVQSGLPPDTKNMPPDRKANVLLRQESDGQFVDVSAESGLADTGYGMGVAVGDVNNDGYPDVYVTNYGADRLFLNKTDGTFVDITEQCGIDNLRWSASACFFDFDGDGWLDLYVTNYVDYFQSRPCFAPSGQEDFCSPSNFAPTADKLFHNVTGKSGSESGEVRFADVTATSRVGDKSGPGLGVVAADFNDDGWQDLYVANDGAANFLWINLKDGTFRDEAVVRGCAYDSLGRPQAGMGIGISDVNQDDRLDLFVTHLFAEINALYLSDEQGGFDESSTGKGLGQPSYSKTGFGTGFLDVDHDGFEDVAVVNGRVARPVTSRETAPDTDAKRFWRFYSEPNQLFRNDGKGNFVIHRGKGEDFTRPVEVSRCLCLGDIDNDGDLDLLLTNTASTARVYLNVAPKKGSWLQVRAVLPEQGGRYAYGARVVVRAGERTFRREVSPGSSYLASNDPRTHFGLGEVEQVDQIEVIWPDGQRESFEGGPANRLVVVERGKGLTQ